MRKKVIGTIAGLLAGAGGALAQSPATMPTGATPRPVAPAGLYDGRVQPVQGVVRPSDGIPPVLPGPSPEAMFGPGGGPEGPGGPGGMPMIPPMGPYGQTPYETPRLRGLGLFGGERAAPRIWTDGQYLLFFPKSQPVTQPLITTSAPADGGVLGRGSTSTLWGATNLSYGASSGFRLSAGFFRPEDQRFGFEVSGLYTSPRSSDFYGQSGGNGVPVLARPFFATDTGTPSAALLSFPTIASGSVLGRTTSSLWGIDASGILNIYRTPPESLRAWAFNFLGGFRYMSLNERLNISSATTVLPGVTLPYAGITVPAPTTITVEDDFTAQNRFYGGQLGFQSQFYAGRWFAGLTGKVALGLVNQRVDINGFTGQNNPTTGVIARAVGGVYANAANVGRYTNDDFGIVTDLNASMGFNVTSWFTITAGYNFIFMNSVARPGYQISGAVDSTKVPVSATFGGAPGPVSLYNIRIQDYYTHGVNFGFNFRY